MKYMTFNSSCSYAGVANMLEMEGLDVEDCQIALDMGLPYLFSFQDGVYCSGPMLQTAEWFNLYLQPRGFRMAEREFPREDVPDFLKATASAMLGIVQPSGGKHAVVYAGRTEGRLQFINNKHKESSEPETLTFSREELAERLEEYVRVAVLQKIPPLAMDVIPYFENSVNVLRQLKREIVSFCSMQQTPQALRAAQGALFRAILLDGVTMLELIGDREMVEMLIPVRKEFLSALRENRTLTLSDRISVSDFEAAIDAYIALISQQIVSRQKAF